MPPEKGGSPSELGAWRELEGRKWDQGTAQIQDPVLAVAEARREEAQQGEAGWGAHCSLCLALLWTSRGEPLGIACFNQGNRGKWQRETKLAGHSWLPAYAQPPGGDPETLVLLLLG